MSMISGHSARAQPCSQTFSVSKLECIHTAAPECLAGSGRVGSLTKYSNVIRRQDQTLVGVFAGDRCGDLPAGVPAIVRLCGIGCCRPLGIAILAVIKTVFGGRWNGEGRTKTVALDIGAAAKWARIKFHITHVPGSAMFSKAAAGENVECFLQSPVGVAPIFILAEFNARRLKTQNWAFHQFRCKVIQGLS